MAGRQPVIAVLGASGLIGEALARELTLEGFAIVPIARRFAAHQAAAFGAEALTAPIGEMSHNELGRLLTTARAAVVVNCLGVLQDGRGGTTVDIHIGFV